MREITDEASWWLEIAKDQDSLISKGLFMVSQYTHLYSGLLRDVAGILDEVAVKIGKAARNYE